MEITWNNKVAHSRFSQSSHCKKHHSWCAVGQHRRCNLMTVLLSWSSGHPQQIPDSFHSSFLLHTATLPYYINLHTLYSPLYSTLSLVSPSLLTRDRLFRRLDMK